ncbi:autotransporter outer membrane beta-barrel domain-containing protein [Pseudomonas sp.]|uniref:autotransporter outer membrane beta-barrel domain-containing protein n=1 Tax=Pseudomonas sp. TaxID=306 RepID=UPI002C9B3A9A|nr:autotransporter-associated beta strand repeat-containing protein [Pseudomonas sp.]HUE91908.1 autotransporter-associated beta strand repeat-containing protein [Pseudomonas sp.]
MNGCHVGGRRWVGFFAGLGVALLTASSQALDFNNSESAGNASIDNENDTLTFNDQSDAGTATVDNNTGTVIFNDQSTAANANIVNIDDATTEFYDQSSAGSATLVNELDGSTEFYGSSSASDATILTEDGGSTEFNGNSTGGNARLIANDSGFVDFSGSTGPNGDNRLSVGSIEGSGNFFLGSVLLSVGSNNLSTEMSGQFSDGTGAALTKVGTGILTLSGDSSDVFNAAISIEGGLINFNSAGSFGDGAITLNGGGLQWATGTTTDISGRLSALGDAGGLFDTNGNDVTLSSALSGTGALSKLGAGLLLLDAANSYSGGTVVEAGILRQGVAGGLVSNTAYTLNGGTLDLNGFDLSMASLAGTGGTLSLGSAQLTLDQAGATTFAGSLNGSGGLTKQGAGTLILSGINSYSGGTVVDAGILRQGVAGGLVSNTAYTLNGGTLDLNGFDLSMASLAGTGGTLSLGSAQLTLDQAGATTFAGSLSGTGGLTKQGAGTLALSGVNTYSGGTVVDAGILRQGVAGGLVSNTAYTLNGGTLDLNGFDLSMASLAGTGGTLSLGSAQLTLNQAGATTFAGSLSGTGGLTKQGTGTLILSGVNTYSGGAVVDAGILRQGVAGGLVSNTAYTLNGGSLDLNDFDLSMASLAGTGGTLSLGSAQLTLNQAGSTTFAGSLSGTGGLTKQGTGTLVLSGVNSYSGGTVVDAGILRQGVAGGLVSGTAFTLNGGTLDLNGFDLSMSSLAGTGGTLSLGSAQLTLNQAGATTFAGSLSGTGGLTKQGTGTLILSGVNTYSGGTVVDAGILRQGVAGGLVSNTAYTLNGGSLDLNDFDLSMSALSGSGALSLGSAQLTLDLASDGSYAGSISGSGGLTKSGVGILNLTGDSTYSDTTTVSGGTLLVNGSLLSSVLVGSGATLGGGGSVGDVTVDAGGILAPGNSIGTLFVIGDLSFDSASIYQVEVDAAGNTDNIIVSGQASLAGTVEVLASSGEYGLGTTYSILSSGSPLISQFDAVTSNLAFLDPSLSYSSNEVFLTLLRNDITFADLALTPNQRAFASSTSSLPLNDEVFRTLINLSTSQVPAAYESLSGDAHASFVSALLLDDLGVPWMPLDNLHNNLSSPDQALPFWVQVQTGHQRSSDDGNAGLVILDHDGLLMGTDWPIFGGWRMGIALGYGDQQLGVSSRDSKAVTDTYRSAAYLGNQLPLPGGKLKFSAGATYSQHQMDGQRSVDLVDGLERLASSYNVGIAQGFSELSFRTLESEQGYFEPFARVVSIDQRSEGFRESGGSAALSAASQVNQLLSSTMGMRGQQKYRLLERELIVNGSLAWRQLQGDLRPEMELSLAEGQTFRVQGTRLPSSSLLLDLHADYVLAPGVGLDVRYKGMSGFGSEGNAFSVSVRWRM